MASCSSAGSCERSIVILTSAVSGGAGSTSVTTIYSGDSSLLADRTVTGNGNSLTFNMGSETFLVMGSLNTSGLITTSSGVVFFPQSGNPNGASTLWIDAEGHLNRGARDLEVWVSSDSGNLVELGSDSGVFLDPATICNTLSSCNIDALGNVTQTSAISGQSLIWNGSQWINRIQSFIVTDSTTSFNVSGNNTVTLNDTTTVNFIIATGAAGLRQISAQVLVAGHASNMLMSGSGAGPGLFVPETYLDFTANNSSSGITQSGTGGHIINMTVVSPASGNILTWHASSGGAFLDSTGFCAALSDCSLGSLGDVTISSPTVNSTLRWTGSVWTDYPGSSGNEFSIDVTDGTNSFALPNSGILTFTDGSFFNFAVNSGAGSVAGHVVVSTSSGNLITNGASSGLYAAQTALVITANNSTSGITQSGTANHIANITVVSPASGNIITWHPGSGGAFLHSTGVCTALNSCSIDALSDVNTTGATNGKVLQYNGTTWVPGSMVSGGGGGGGVLSSLTQLDAYRWRHNDGSGTTVDFDVRDGISPSGGNEIQLDSSGRYWFHQTRTLISQTNGIISFTDESGTISQIAICEMLNACKVSGLGDVANTVPASGQVLTWHPQSGLWVPKDAPSASTYSFDVFDGSTTQTIANGNTLTFSDTSTINATVAATDTVTMAVKVAPTSMTIAGDSGDIVFDNNIVITSSGIFAPCIQALPPTISSQGGDPVVLWIPCGETYSTLSLPYYEEVLRPPVNGTEVVEGDAAPVGADLSVSANTGELFYHSLETGFEDKWRKVPGTYGFFENASFSAGIAKSFVHNLNTDAVIVQVYLGGSTPYYVTVPTEIRIQGPDEVFVTLPINSIARVIILPVYNLA